MDRVPELIDVWFDSGAMPYAQWHAPFENQEIFEEQFPQLKKLKEIGKSWKDIKR